MLQVFRQLARLHPATLFSAGGVLMVVSSMLMVAHVATIIEVRDVSVPIVGQLPQLERKRDVLKEQVELTELHSATTLGSTQEKIEVYALPERTDVSRLIATFEILRDVLERDALLSSMSDIQISEPGEGVDGATVQRVSTKIVAHEDGVRTVLSLVRLAGFMTVGDALTEQEVALLIDRVEQENPSGIVALEQFLSADLISYAKDPKAYEQQLKRSFSSTAFFNALENVVRTSLLHDAKLLLHSDLGEALQTYKLWPMQIMVVEDISFEHGTAPKWYTLSLTLQVFSDES